MFFPLIETPVDPCYPSPCGDNAICNKHRTRERAATCVCIQGYFGDPFLSCRPECTQNNDCPTNRVCKNQKCVDPCPGLCGINAVCSVSNHRPSCDCLQGYTGNPSVSCNLSKICFVIINEIVSHSHKLKNICWQTFHYEFRFTSVKHFYTYDIKFWLETVPEFVN